MQQFFTITVLLLMTASLAHAGSFAKPTTSSSSSVSALHDQVLQLKVKITTIEIALDARTGNQINLLSQLGEEQRSIERLQKQVDNMRLLDTVENRENAKQLESLSTLLTQLQAGVDQMKMKNAIRLATSQCVEEILSDDFDEAKKYFALVESDNKIKFIVDQVYNNNNGAKFSLVLSFADSLGNIPKALKLYNALSELVLRNSANLKDTTQITSLISRIESFGIRHGEPLASLKTLLTRRSVVAMSPPCAHHNFKFSDCELTYFYIQNIDSKLVVEVKNANRAVSAPIVMNHYQGTAHQLWAYKGNTLYSKLNGMVLDSSYGDLVVSPCSNRPEHLWFFEGVFLRNGNGKYMDVPGNNKAAGTKLKTYVLNHSGAQKYSLIPV